MAMWIDLLEKYMIGNTEYSIFAHAVCLILQDASRCLISSSGQSEPSRVKITLNQSNSATY